MPHSKICWWNFIESKEDLPKWAGISGIQEILDILEDKIDNMDSQLWNKILMLKM